ncbi:MAG: glycosyltransferase family 2 protein [archaeon]
MRNKKLSVIVPVFKGGKFIEENLSIMKKSFSEQFANTEIIAVIDGSTDDSLSQAKKVEGIKVVGYTKNMGKGYALKYGFKHATGDFITFIDCDMNLHPKQLRNFVPYLSTADIVIGSKRHPFSKVNYPLTRKILSKGFQLYSWLVLGVSLRDTQSGLKIMKREALEVLLPLVVVKRYAFDLELMFLAQMHGFRTVEAPILLNYDREMPSTVDLKAAYGMFMDVLAIRYRFSFTKYYQKQYHNQFK